MITVAVDSQVLNSMDFCWHRYKLEHVDLWSPNKKAPALEKGSLVHVFMKHYVTGKKNNRHMNPQDWKKLLKEAEFLMRESGSSMGIGLDEIDETVDACNQYADHYQFDGIEVLAVEEPFSRILYEDEKVRIIWQGILDLVARLPGEPVAVFDYKSEQRQSTPSSLSNQFEGYAWAMSVDTVVVDKIGFQKTLKPEEKFRRLRLDYSGKKRTLLHEWRRDAINKILEGVERHKMEAQGKAYWPRNRTSCDKYSGCIFKGVCENQPDTRDVKLVTFFHLGEPWDPFKRDKAVETEEAV